MHGLALASRAEEYLRVIKPGPPPPDALVLFDCTDLSQWRTKAEGKGRLGGQATINGTGSIVTKLPVFLPRLLMPSSEHFNKA